MNKLTFKQIQFVGLLLSGFVILASFFLEYVRHLEPCPLCLMQRFCTYGLLLTFAWTYYKDRARNLFISIALFFSLFGLFLALRHLYLYTLPIETLTTCTPGLDVLMRYFPWQAVVHALFWGSNSCTHIDWAFLGFPMPAWAILYFLLILAISIASILRQRQKKQ